MVLSATTALKGDACEDEKKKCWLVFGINQKMMGET